MTSTVEILKPRTVKPLAPQTAGASETPAPLPACAAVQSYETPSFQVTEDNRVVYDRVMSVTQAEYPQNLFIYGPPHSGKTTLVHERGRERDLLSTKRVMFCHALEAQSMFNLGTLGEEFLQRIGSVDILLIDGFEHFFTEDAIAQRLCQLLLEERARNQLSTLVFSSMTLDQVPPEIVEGSLAHYELLSLPHNDKTD